MYKDQSVVKFGKPVRVSYSLVMQLSSKINDRIYLGLKTILVIKKHITQTSIFICQIFCELTELQC